MSWQAHGTPWGCSQSLSHRHRRCVITVADGERAPRPDALSFPGSTPEIVSPFDTALLAQIQQCICQLKNLVEVCCPTSQIDIITVIIESGFDFIESQIEVLTELTQSCCEHVESQLDVLTACASTPIFAPITITVPGPYCLANDITGDIVVAVSNVEINLNGHTVFGSIIINSLIENVAISNGFIEPDDADGIFIDTGAADIYLSYIDITNAENGVNAAGTALAPITGLVMSSMSANGCSTDGFSLHECSGLVSECSASGNGNAGFLVDGDTSSFVIKNASASGNLVGIDLSDGTTYECLGCSVTNNQQGIQATLNSGVPIVCRDCYSAFNVGVTGNTGTGFRLNSGNMIATNCTALSNGFMGFIFQSGTNIDISYCFASQNVEIGFYVNNFNTNITNPFTDITGLIANCVSTQNTDSGFNVHNGAGVTAVRFISNYAADNPTFNYGAQRNSGNPGVAIPTNTPPYNWLSTLNSAATYWRNVDGNA